VAVIKATTPQFHVPPKEKHVKSAGPALPLVFGGGGAWAAMGARD